MAVLNIGQIDIVSVGALVCSGAPQRNAVLLEPFDHLAAVVMFGLIRMLAVAPHYQICLLAQLSQRLAGPVDHHVVPQQRADTAPVQLIQDGLDVVQIKRAFAMLVDVGLGVRVRAEGPRLVAAQVEVLKVRRPGDHLVDHAFDQLARSVGQGVQHV